MTTKTLIRILLGLGFQVLIVVLFVLLLAWLPSSLFWLDLIVVSVISWSCYLAISNPWIDLDDRTQKQVGGLAIKWSSIWYYTVAAGVVAIAGLFTYQYFTPALQWVVQLLLALLLISSFFITRMTESKVADVYCEQQEMAGGVASMARSTERLRDALIGVSGLRPDVEPRVGQLEAEIRFISPANTAEAAEVERQYSALVNDIIHALADPEVNADRIDVSLQRAARLVERRKKIYST